jgi:hypothetical protein
MSARSNHVPIDRLTALAFVARAPEDAQDRQVLTHISSCDRCAAQLARLTADATRLRSVAFDEADAVFDDAMLEGQRGRILDRLASLGQAARVLRFPRRHREVAMPVSTGTRRWVSVAAAAGLIIGLLAGQVIHFVPWGTARRDAATSLQAPSHQTDPSLIPAAVATVSDEQLLDEIEAAVQLRRAHSLRALDALTPTAGDFREIRLQR